MGFESLDGLSHIYMCVAVNLAIDGLYLPRLSTPAMTTESCTPPRPSARTGAGAEATGAAFFGNIVSRHNGRDGYHSNSIMYLNGMKVRACARRAAWHHWS